jgi:hypothetical protein
VVNGGSLLRRTVDHRVSCSVDTLAKRLASDQPRAALCQQELATSLVPNSPGDTVITVTVNRTLRTSVAILLLTAIRMSAHHSFAAEFDEDKLITISGFVSKFEWINPHGLLSVRGTDSAGKAGSWKFEMGSPGSLESLGWKKTDLKTGDRITVEGYAAKDGSNKASARMVRLADGRKLFGGSQCTPGNPLRFPIHAK